MKTSTKWLCAACLSIPTVIYAVVLTDDGLDTSGNNTVVDGGSSVAIGSGNTANNKSLAVGVNNSVWGNSLAVGSGNMTSGNALAVGTSNTTYGEDSIALGMGNFVSGNAASGDTNFAIGIGNSWSTWGGTANVAIGRNNRSNGIFLGSDSIMIGVDNYLGSQASKSWMIGEGHSSNVEGSVFLGTYSEVPSEPIALAVGTGTSDTSRANGLEVHKNGDVIIPKRQGDISMGAFGE